VRGGHQELSLQRGAAPEIIVSVKVARIANPRNSNFLNPGPVADHQLDLMNLMLLIFCY